MIILVGGIVGTRLAPIDKLSTLPIACMVVGTAVFTIPIALLMKRFDRRAIFIFMTAYSILMSLLAGLSVHFNSFYMLCFCLVLMGAVAATVLQFRFAAMESVEIADMPKAASTVLLGGIIAAFLGPEVAVRGKDLISEEFVGSFVILAGLLGLSLLFLFGFKNPELHQFEESQSKRKIFEILKNPVFWVAVIGGLVGYSVMSFIMTATPVSMHVMDGHALDKTKWVIQSHIVAMFLPSFFTAFIIRKLGIVRMMMIGLIAFLICILIAYLSHDLINYWVSLVLLGVGWNFLFIGGTTLLPQTYQSNERFKVQAINDFLIFGGQAISSLSAGWLVFAIGWEDMLLITLPLIFLQFGMIAYWQNLKNKRSLNIPGNSF